MNLGLILEGIGYGITLAMMVGAIVVTLTQTGVNHGIRAGIAVGSGVWTSDFLIIALLILFFVPFSANITHPSFQWWMGIAGSIILLFTGIITALKPAKLDLSSIEKRTFSDYFSFWLKGFLVNTVNPFTFIFWLGLGSSYLVLKKLNTWAAIQFFGSILCTIIITDILKVYFAKKIRTMMKENTLQCVSKISGGLLVVFGLVLMLRTIGVF